MINIDDLTEKELDELRNELNKRESKKIYNDNITAIKNNREYIGKCYKEKNNDKFIRVLSSKSSNPFRLECMCFELPVKFSENYNSRFSASNSMFSNIDFDGIYIEDYPLLCSDYKTHGKVLNTLVEITEEEYFDKMDEYISNLQKMIKNNDFDTSKNI